MKFLSVNGVAFILSLSGSVMPMVNDYSSVLPIPDTSRDFSFTCGGGRKYSKNILDRYVDHAMAKMANGDYPITTDAFSFTLPEPYYIVNIDPDGDVTRTGGRDEYVIFNCKGIILGAMTYAIVDKVPKFVPCQFS